MLDGLLLWQLEAAAALELPPALLFAACDGGGNADAALVRPLLLHGANDGRSCEVPSSALPSPIVIVAFAPPMPAAALADTMVRAYLRVLRSMCRQYFWLGSCGMWFFWDLVVARSQKFVNHSPHNDVFPLPYAICSRRRVIRSRDLSYSKKRKK